MRIMSSLFGVAELQRYSVRFDGFADLEVIAIGAIEAVAAARHRLMTERGVRKAETLASGRITFVEAV